MSDVNYNNIIIVSTCYKKHKCTTWLNSTSLLLMPNKLSRVAHLFKTFVTFIASLVFFSMGTHMRHRISLILIFVGTKVTRIPATILMCFQMSVIITNTFKLFTTVWFRTFKGTLCLVNQFMLVQVTLEWKSLPTRNAQIVHVPVIIHVLVQCCSGTKCFTAVMAFYNTVIGSVMGVEFSN